MLGILKYLIIMALVAHNLKMATACNHDDLKQMFVEKMQDAKKRDRPYDLLHMGICLLTLGPAVLVRTILDSTLEAFLNLLDIGKKRFKEAADLGKPSEAENAGE